jgi:hypothetical protein
MAKLIYSLEGAVLGDFTLDKERITIGRRPSNDIHIDNLAVSGEHAAIVTIGRDSFLEDLDSSNGTLVNGKPIKKHVLQNGDVIEIGKYQLKYVSEAVANTEAAGGTEDFEKTMIIRPSAMKAMPPENDAAKMQATNIQPPVDNPTPDVLATSVKPPPPPQAPAEGVMLGNVQVLSGPSMGKQLVLNKALTTLGKPGVGVAIITRRSHGYFITHVQGQTYPVVNGNSVGAQAHELNDHDVIELVGVKMEFFLTKA